VLTLASSRRGIGRNPFTQKLAGSGSLYLNGALSSELQQLRYFAATIGKYLAAYSWERLSLDWR